MWSGVNSSYSSAVPSRVLVLRSSNNPMTFRAPVPEIPAASVDKAAAYYVNTLGFTFDWGDEQGGIAGISRGNCRLFILMATLFVSSMISGATCERTTVDPVSGDLESRVPGLNPSARPTCMSAR